MSEGKGFSDSIEVILIVTAHNSEVNESVHFVTMLLVSFSYKTQTFKSLVTITKLHTAHTSAS